MTGLIKIGSGITLLMLLSSCMLVGPNYERPTLALPESYGEVGQSLEPSTLNEVPNQWWTLYQDPELNALVEKAFNNNSSIKSAVARIEEADAQMRESGASLLPTVDLGGNGTRTRLTESGPFPPFGQNPRNNFNLALSSAVELDFWGKLRRAKEAARANFLATTFAKEMVKLTTESLVVSTYFNIRSLDSQLMNVKENLKFSEESLALAKRRQEGGIVSILDVQQASLVRDNLLSQEQELIRSRKLAEHVLNVLTLEEVKLAQADLASLPMPPTPPLGLPSAILENRPDVREAEQTMVAANANIGLAKAALYPSISLTGTFGGESVELGDVLKSASRIWSYGLSLNLPIFNGGALSARVDQASAREKQALQSYVGTVATAFKEVNDALVNLRQYKAIEAIQASKKETTQDMLGVAQNRYKAGYSSYLDVLEAQRSHIEALQSFVISRQNTLTATVDLFKALGGGWQNTNDEEGKDS
ncbi:MAG: efflux transporter outer membrane subunit [Methylophilaceae bacterium]